MTKLERYIHELSGFLSIVPRRARDDGAVTYSPYIGYELSLARRSRVPRLLFVDDEILNRYRSRFPGDAVPFVRSSPASDRFRHIEAVREFKKTLEIRGSSERPRYRDRSVVLVSASTPAVKNIADVLMDALHSRSYSPRQIAPEQLPRALDDVELLESILSAEFCVFLLDQQVTYANVLFAMAYAHSVPSMRLQYDPAAVKAEAVTETGAIRWSSSHDVLLAFQDQVDSYRMGFVEAIAIQDIRKIGITNRTPRPEQIWDPSDGAGLIKHIDPNNAHVREVVAAARKLKGGSLVGVNPFEICQLVYGFIRTLHFAYEYEPPTLVEGRQAIRSADDIWNDNAGTCLDLACLFASLLKAAGLTPVLVILMRPDLSHALVGYRAPGSAHLPSAPDLGDIRGSLTLGEIILFESTGAAEHETAVGGESAEERRKGNRTLEFETAKTAADRLIGSQVELKYVLIIL